MEELGIPIEEIGSSDHSHGIALAAFNPHEDVGGLVGTGKRINLDAGLVNDDLLTPRIRRGMRPSLGGVAAPGIEWMP